mmetsp:Transcript_100060/g.254419  ORF Transcript_100060/g.254419 Transcript_100060/m.254419 type:complete len:295 (+) Transcript_100060:287-1171(+)
MGDRLLVRRRTVLGDHRGAGEATLELTPPDPIPPALVPLRVRDPFRRARIANLWPVVVPDAAMRVVDVGDDELNSLIQDWIGAIRLGNVDPMRKVCGELDGFPDVRVLQQKVAGDPRRMQKALAVRLVTDDETLLRFPSQCGAKELQGHLLREVVFQGMRDHHRQNSSRVFVPVAEQLVSLLDLLLENLQVCLHHLLLQVCQRLLRLLILHMLSGELLEALLQALCHLLPRRRGSEARIRAAPQDPGSWNDNVVGEDHASHLHVVLVQQSPHSLSANMQCLLEGHFDAIVAELG